MYQVPIFYRKDGQKKIWFTASGEMPTAAALNENLQYEVKCEKEGDELVCSSWVTDREARAIQIFSSLAADQSQTLSGMLLRSLGDIQIALVVGGHFSIGDNDTFSELATVFVEISLRRLTEASAYYVFRSEGEPEHMENILKLIEFVSNAVGKEEKKA